MNVLAILPAGLLALAGTALAQNPSTPVTPTPPAPATLSELDTDKDGSISRSEAAQNVRLGTQFQNLDANGNGALEGAEFARFETTTSPMAAPPPLNSVPPPATTTPPPSTTTPAPNATTPPPSGASPAPNTTTPPPR